MDNYRFGKSVDLKLVYSEAKDGGRPTKKIIFHTKTMNTAKSLEPVKDLSYEGDKTKLSGKYLFSPQGTFKILWDIFILIFVVMQGVYIPLLVAFDFEVSTSFTYFDLLISFSLTLDILFNFNSGYVKKGALIMNRNLIMKNYLKTWFLLDFISSFPYQWAINHTFELNNYSSTHSNANRAPGLLRLVKLSKLLSIFRLFKLVKVNLYFYKIEDFLNNDIAGRLLTIFRICIVVFFVAHWNACIWYFITKNFIEEETWLNAIIHSSSSSVELYVDSLYWSIYTMISVGYGDIKLVSVKERILAIFSMVIASGLFGYLLGQLSLIIGQQTQHRAEYQALKVNLRHLLFKYNVPSTLQRRVQNYVNYAYENHLQHQKESQILSCLSIPLQEEITYLVNWPIFQHCHLFSKFFGKSLLETFSASFNKSTYSPFDMIIKQNSREREIFFLAEGEIEAYLPQSKRKVSYYENEGYFGEVGFFGNIPRTANVISVGFSHVLSLSYERAWKALSRYPNAQKTLVEIEFECKQDLGIIDIRCSFCAGLGHVALMCFDKRFEAEKKIIKSHWIRSKSLHRSISNRKYNKTNYKRKFKNAFDISPLYRSRHSKVEDLFSQESLRDKVVVFAEAKAEPSVNDNKKDVIPLEEIYIDSDINDESTFIIRCEPSEEEAK